MKTLVASAEPPRPQPEVTVTVSMPAQSQLNTLIRWMTTVGRSVHPGRTE